MAAQAFVTEPLFSKFRSCLISTTTGLLSPLNQAHPRSPSPSSLPFTHNTSSVNEDLLDASQTIQLQPLSSIHSSTDTDTSQSKSASDLTASTDDSSEYSPGSMRCRNCQKRFYSNNLQDKECHYHPGTYRVSTPIDLLIVTGWSCCGAYHHHTLGCHVARHVEDVPISIILDTYFPNEEYSRSSSEIQLPTSKMVSKPKSSSGRDWQADPNIVGKDFVEHHVQLGDTFTGLALKYGTTTEKIKRANRMYSNSIVNKSVLRIPVINKMDHDWLCKRFVEKTNCPHDEATYYLEDADWNLDDALLHFADDFAWAKQTTV
eukprot:TRINITY_DN18959_c0_g1_i1.p1 TRINITY_DN18959_c0_g1~~TRINITY_DN18959_c0_g1_i1.p1  ORF type:complete len:334 (+),score=56.10 TRINITY_DN18959_c0_g1_i1:51-1004(+)